jgi:hypothetical protein
MLGRQNPDIILPGMDLAANIAAELELARAARKAGNEGRARVCARRAAGLAARDYLDRHGLKPRGTAPGADRTGSAYVALQALEGLPALPPHLLQAARNLTMRVSGEFQLPAGIDLIDEAKKLIGGLK